MILVPRTLLLRTFLLLAILMLVSVVAWFQIYRYYERQPRARQLGQLIVSVVNLTRAALVNADPLARRDLLLDLSDREGIRIYPAFDQQRVEPLTDRPWVQMVTERVRTDLGANTRFARSVDGDPGLWVSFRIEEDEYWVQMPRERLERKFPAEWIGWGAAAVALSLVGAWLIVFRLTRPLKALSAAARAVGQGKTPPPLDEKGPLELVTVVHAFNQMSRDLTQLDADRALILAGISHDLRTPLARLRLGMEMSGVDPSLREGMEADIEEMDRIIGQFLDFARDTGGEAAVPTDVAGLVQAVTEQYQKRGVDLRASLAPLPVASLRPLALRRVLSNLIDNALRYAGDAKPVELAARNDGGRLVLEVSDRGPGIPSDQVERLKRPFTRLEQARSNVSGAGLGLAIVERIVRSHGGELQLLPRDGGGLCARVLLPLKNVPGAAI